VPSTGESLATEAAERWQGSGIGLLVQRHAEMQWALQEMEELPEWEVEECGNHCASVDQRDHDIASAVQSVHAQGEHQARG
jgi:hypothetical protein